MSEINYQEAYEREHEKCADLADKIVVLESEKEDLQFKLDRIKKNKFWKATGPARSLIHFAQRQRDRLSHCGGPKDILRKIRNKSRQKSLMKSYGCAKSADLLIYSAMTTFRHHGTLTTSMMSPLLRRKCNAAYLSHLG